MRHGKNIQFVGTTVTYHKVVPSKFNYKQRYAIELIVEKLNESLYKTGKLQKVKRPYNKDDVVALVEQLFKLNNCNTYDEAIDILKKQLKEKNFDIYKS